MGPRSWHWLELRAANGLAIPYLGYLELEVRLCDKLMPWCGVLVVKDPPGGVSSQVPGMLGMNVIYKCYRELFGQHGLALFDLLVISGAPKSVVQALQKCHQASEQAPPAASGKVRVRGRSAWRIPGGTIKIVTATCSEQYSGNTALFEPLDSNQARLLVSPALVRVVRGTAFIPVVNVGSTGVLLYPHTVVGSLEEVRVVSLPAGVTEVPSQVATMASHSASSTLHEQIGEVDLSSLPAEGQGRVKALLEKYAPVFSSHDGDLGCTNLIAHDIPLLDDVPIRQRYKRISPPIMKR